MYRIFVGKPAVKTNYNIYHLDTVYIDMYNLHAQYEQVYYCMSISQVTVKTHTGISQYISLTTDNYS